MNENWSNKNHLLAISIWFSRYDLSPCLFLIALSSPESNQIVPFFLLKKIPKAPPYSLFSPTRSPMLTSLTHNSFFLPRGGKDQSRHRVSSHTRGTIIKSFDSPLLLCTYNVCMGHNHYILSWILKHYTSPELEPRTLWYIIPNPTLMINYHHMRWQRLHTVNILIIVSMKLYRTF